MTRRIQIADHFLHEFSRGQGLRTRRCTSPGRQGRLSARGCVRAAGCGGVTHGGTTSPGTARLRRVQGSGAREIHQALLGEREILRVQAEFGIGQTHGSGFEDGVAGVNGIGIEDGHRGIYNVDLVFRNFDDFKNFLYSASSCLLSATRCTRQNVVSNFFVFVLM